MMIDEGVIVQKRFVETHFQSNLDKYLDILGKHDIIFTPKTNFTCQGNRSMACHNYLNLERK